MSNERDPLAALPRSVYGSTAMDQADAQVNRNAPPIDDGDEIRQKDPIHRGKAPKNIKSTLMVMALAVVAGVYFWSENFAQKSSKKVDATIVQPVINPEATAADLKSQAEAADAKRRADFARNSPLPKVEDHSRFSEGGSQAPEKDDAQAIEVARQASEKTRKELILASGMEPKDVEIDRSAQNRQAAADTYRQPTGNAASSANQSQLLDYLKTSGAELNNTLRDTASAERASATELAARQEANAKAASEFSSRTATDRFYERFEGKAIKAASLIEPARPRFTLYQGTIVRVVLETHISTEAPGAFRARVISDVLDSVNMNTILIPRGSIIMGVYMTNVAMGQSRLVAATERLILPNGQSINLVGTPPSDMQGTAGIPATVNNQYFKMFAGSFLVGAASLLMPKSDQNITVNVGSNGTQIGGTIFATTIADIIKKIGDRNQQVQPIASVGIGSEFTLMFTQDYIMQPYVKSQFE